MDMTKVSASQFKARLGRYMQEVRRGGAVLITDRGVPVAQLQGIQARQSSHVPSEKIPSPATRDPRAQPLGRVTVKGIAYRGRSSLSLLEEDRRR